MIRSFDIRVPIALFFNICWVFVISSINSELAPHAYILLPAILIVPPAALLNFGGSMLVVGLTSLLLEAFIPVRFFLTCAFSLAAALFIHGMRFRLRTLDAFSMTCFMELVNLILILLFALCMKSDICGFYETALRISVDMAASALALLLIGAFSYKLLNSVLNLFEMPMSLGMDDK